MSDAALWVSAIGAAATAVAAGGAWRSAALARRAAEAALVSRMLNDYGDASMSEALQVLHHWAEKHGDAFVEEWDKAWKRGEQEARAVDFARQKVGTYFGTAYKLYQRRMLSRANLKAVAAVSGLHAVRDYLLALEPKVNQNADCSAYHHLLQLCEAERITGPNRRSFGCDRV